ncbi:late embryogenesis abundant protein At1g64065 [Ziziphus jujuba]|uniref:Late embryogenesis abundant protein At1g64065 n=2 Tax=Ziziphus jujuba TaxID=326968 RepID=A0ABM3IDV8_ZIZJJ|nr:late embryogenesis abundant protein At1g64065 [Ziziphus jujuba]KAH7538119.1 hypothetical protein FEM48_Zijuj03G0165300 [Ziziphus jujuba var. spinosa]
MTTTNPGSARGSNKKRNWIILILAWIILHVVFILLFVLLFLRVRSPKVRLGSVSVETINLNTSSAAPSFDLKLNAQVTIKNKNFGRFKFHNSTATISYRGTEVGQATIDKGKAKARSTKKINNVMVSVKSNKVSSNSAGLLRSDLSSKNLTFSAYTKLEGKVHLFLIFKKKKSAQMNCTFIVNTATKGISDLSCK